jgi:hypothetical protein
MNQAKEEMVPFEIFSKLLFTNRPTFWAVLSELLRALNEM